jgi:hypothetical protein
MCPLSAFIWSVVKEELKWERLPRSVKEFNDDCLCQRGAKLNSVLFFLLGVVCWTIWLNRNNFVSLKIKSFQPLSLSYTG